MHDQSLVPHEGSPDASLPALADEIRRHHEASMSAGKATLEHARHAGLALLEAKAKLPHGQFGPWVKANCPFSHRSAANYIKVAQNWDALQAREENSSALPISSVRGFLSNKRAPIEDGLDAPGDKEPAPDGTKQPVPARLRPLFEFAKVYPVLFRAMKALIVNLSKLEDTPAGKHLDGIREKIKTLDSIFEWARAGQPRVCPFCSRDRPDPRCKACHGDGWLSAAAFKRATEFEQGQ
jgi:hypothetical protein